MGLNNDKDYNVYKIEIFPTWQKIKNENNDIIVEGSKLSIYDILMGLDIKFNFKRDDGNTVILEVSVPK